MVKPRTAKEVIDAAIRENRSNEYLLYFLGFFAFILGAVIVVWGLWNDKPVWSFMGILESGLFAPAFTLISRTRKQNLGMRMMEFPLSYSRTSKEAALALVKFVCDPELKNVNQEIVEESKNVHS